MSADDPLAERDLGFVEPFLPAAAALLRGYFRAEVRGLDRMPDGGALLVGNHSGGFGSPDSVIFAVAFHQYFGVQRPLAWMGHRALMHLPVLTDFLRRCGVVEASPDTAVAVLRAGAVVLAYPGGEAELHRPWTARGEIRFGGHQGFLRTAREAGVPVVPVVSYGGHNTYLPLWDGAPLARRLGLNRLGIRAFPVALSLPWGIDVGGVLPHLPLPARIRVEVLDPIEVGGDIDADYEKVTATMQQAIERLRDT